jgi:hypothetical protein
MPVPTEAPVPACVAHPDNAIVQAAAIATIDFDVVRIEARRPAKSIGFIIVVSVGSILALANRSAPRPNFTPRQPPTSRRTERSEGLRRERRRSARG